MVNMVLGLERIEAVNLVCTFSILESERRNSLLTPPVPLHRRIPLLHHGSRHQGLHPSHVLPHLPNQVHEMGRPYPGGVRSALVDRHYLGDHLPVSARVEGVQTVHGDGVLSAEGGLLLWELYP